jgi:hypothetical protein
VAPAAVALVRVEVLMAFANPEASGQTDFGYGPDDDAPVDAIWQDILEHGMADPLVVSLCRPRSYNDPGFPIRLESGNHRLRPALASGVTHLPAVGIVSERLVHNPDNGGHFKPGDRARYQDWLRRIGRDSVRFEPYPHPGPLADLLPLDVLTDADAVIPLLEVVFDVADAGLVRFKRKTW